MSGALSRSTVSVAVSSPEPASVPQSTVSGTDRVEYQGPPASSTLWPAGGASSAVMVSASVAVRPALFVAVTAAEPGSAAPDVHA